MKTFTIPVVRVSYQHANIMIFNAKTKKEAERKALDEAGNYEFREKSAEYELEGGPNQEVSEREQMLIDLLRNIHDEIGRRADEGDQGAQQLDNCEAILRIRKEIFKKVKRSKKSVRDLLKELYGSVCFAVQYGATELARLNKEPVLDEISKELGVEPKHKGY